ncbi:MAG: aldo/keto reductase [Pseudanabaenaceae cyanobacterium]
MDKVAIGRTDIKTVPLGIGTWAWGDKWYWTYGKDYGEAQVKSAFKAAIDNGITLFDTAEIYGFGESESLIGRMTREVGRASVQIATKYMPAPWRVFAQQVERALDKSLARLQTDSVELYQVHIPFTFFMSQKTLLGVLAKAVKAGKIQAIGVSNYSAKQMRTAYEILKAHKIPLAANQVHYSLLSRQIETNGVLQTAQDLGVTILAYSPLEQGLLTGKYTTLINPTGARQFNSKFGQKYLYRIEPLLRSLRELSETYGCSPAQIALNWLIRRGTIPIPGAKNAHQAQENAGALGWELDPADSALLARVSSSL